MEATFAMRSAELVDQALSGAAQKSVVDLGHAGGPAIALRINAQDDGYKVQTVLHRWTLADIKKYRIQLHRFDKVRGYYVYEATGTIDVQDPRTGVTIAAFKNLAPNERYHLWVDVMGSNPSSPATSVLQRMTLFNHAAVQFDFLENADADIQDHVFKTLTIQLDHRAFGGNANVNINVQDGTFAAPTSKPVFMTPAPDTTATSAS